MFLNPTPSLNLKRPKSTNFTTTNPTNNYSSDYEALVEEQRQSFFGDFSSNSPERLRGESPKHKPDERASLQPRIIIQDEWAAMQAFMDKQDSPVEGHAWEQYADLGGFRRA